MSTGKPWDMKPYHGHECGRILSKSGTLPPSANTLPIGQRGRSQGYCHTDFVHHNPCSVVSTTEVCFVGIWKLKFIISSKASSLSYNVVSPKTNKKCYKRYMWRKLFVSKEWHKEGFYKWKAKHYLDRKTQYNEGVESYSLSLKFKSIQIKQSKGHFWNLIKFS